MKLFKKIGLKKYIELNENSPYEYPNWPLDGIVLAYSGFVVLFDKKYLEKYSILTLIKASFIYYFLEQHLLNKKIYSLFSSEDAKSIAFDFLINFNLNNKSIKSDSFSYIEKENFDYYTFDGKKYHFYGKTFKGFNKPGLWLVNDATKNDTIFLTDGSDFNFSIDFSYEKLSSIFDNCMIEFRSKNNKDILKEFIFKILLDN